MSGFNQITPETILNDLRYLQLLSSICLKEQNIS